MILRSKCPDKDIDFCVKTVPDSTKLHFNTTNFPRGMPRAPSLLCVLHTYRHCPPPWTKQKPERNPADVYVCTIHWNSFLNELKPRPHTIFYRPIFRLPLYQRKIGLGTRLVTVKHRIPSYFKISFTEVNFANLPNSREYVFPQ